MAETFKVEGFEELFKQMDALREEIGKGKTDRIWRKVLGDAMQPVLSMAKEFAPGAWKGSTGQLKEHIFLKVQKPNAMAQQSASYQGEMYMASVYVSPLRNDSVQNVKINKKGKEQVVWTGKKPVALSQEFGNKRLQNSEFGTAAKGAHPFLRPALENNIGRIQTILGYAIMDALEKYDGMKKG